eukprot:351457-Chlamydomonas_euryale.AAC.2
MQQEARLCLRPGRARGAHGFRVNPYSSRQSGPGRGRGAHACVPCIGGQSVCLLQLDKPVAHDAGMHARTWMRPDICHEVEALECSPSARQ